MNELINKSVFVIREAKSKLKNIAVLWSTGKDSTAMLFLIKQTFGSVPFPVIHIDTGYHFKEVYEFRDRIAHKLNLELIIAKNDKAIERGLTFPEGRTDRLTCCHLLKTIALKNVIEEHSFDGVFVGIRWDEIGIRGYERYFSPRDKDFKWKYKNQPMEMGYYFSGLYDNCHHVRIHPMLHWSELDVWLFIKRENIPVNPLYFSRNGYRYRSIGCFPCTKPIKSDAKSIDEIINEIRERRNEERIGREQSEELMLRLRALGYM